MARTMPAPCSDPSATTALAHWKERSRLTRFTNWCGNTQRHWVSRSERTRCGRPPRPTRLTTRPTSPRCRSGSGRHRQGAGVARSRQHRHDPNLRSPQDPAGGQPDFQSRLLANARVLYQSGPATGFLRWISVATPCCSSRRRAARCLGRAGGVTPRGLS